MSLFTVMVPTNVTESVQGLGWACPRASQPEPVIQYTRKGRMFGHIESAKRLAKRFQGRVIDLNSRLVVIDYLMH